jgi:hypothetical protein
MKKVHILVEGSTEESFVNNVIKPYFEAKEILIKPIIVSTKRVKSGKKFKGGVTTYTHVKSDVLKLLGDTSADLVTTMIDYYGLPSDFPGIKSAENTKPHSRLNYIEKAFQNDIGSRKFYAFLVQHEFEGLLFTNPEEIARKILPRGKEKELKKIRDQFPSPEHINNNPSTAPSKRIANIFPDYDKVADGPIIAQRIGLDAIRKECTHFNDWIVYIESRCSEK